MTRRVLDNGKVGSYGLDDVVLPNGHRTTLQILRHPGASAVVPFVDDETVLLLRQYRYAPDAWLWEVPAGKLDPGESPEACITRELEEETGWRAGRIERVGEILTTPGFTDELIHLFCGYDLTPGTVARGPSELIEVHEVALAAAVEMVARGEIIDGKTIAGLWHAWRLRR
jgi:ADP-ribose pyrophosphatase